MFNSIPGFKEWAMNPDNGISDSFDLEGVIWGGLARYVKETYYSEGRLPQDLESSLVVLLNEEVERNNRVTHDLLLTEFGESLNEDEVLFMAVLKKLKPKAREFLAKVNK